ncbi:MAG: gliding motility-associated C-terminal domain-containing protein [Bacteroidota bacterium]
MVYLLHISIGLMAFCGLFAPSQDGDQHLTAMAGQTLTLPLPSLGSDAECALELVREPAYGRITTTKEGDITYEGDKEHCGEQDQVSWAFCRNGQQELLNFYIDILCEPLIIYSGFSPNGDGINDAFTIRGVENFPNNELSIYDFSGKEIYRQQSYQNDWNGTTRTGEPLSDASTYFYIFEDGEGNSLSGSFRING